MNIKPLGNRIVISLIKQKTETVSGIIISTEEKNEQVMGKVIEIGEGSGSKYDINNTSIKKGDVVLFAKFTGDDVIDPNNPDIVYKILKGEDVLAIIDNK